MKGPRNISSQEKFCSACGEIILREAEICPRCGVRQMPVPVHSSKKVAAGVLAILLGGIGAHKFYLGRPGMGVLYLVFCWTLIPAVIGLIEGIIYLTTSDEEFIQEYGA